MDPSHFSTSYGNKSSIKTHFISIIFIFFFAHSADHGMALSTDVISTCNGLNIKNANLIKGLKLEAAPREFVTGDTTRRIIHRSAHSEKIGSSLSTRSVGVNSHPSPAPVSSQGVPSPNHNPHLRSEHETHKIGSMLFHFVDSADNVVSGWFRRILEHSHYSSPPTTLFLTNYYYY